MTSLTLYWSICLAEFRLYSRYRLIRFMLITGLLLLTCSCLVSWQRQQDLQQQRHTFQQLADQQWQQQPDRHPHRVVHYGHFVFHQQSPLAFFDFGISPYTGQMLYLEGHRQNSSNFSEATQASTLMRNFQLSPAMVLQVLLPLLLIVTGYASLAGEREHGQLRQVLALGVAPGHLLIGKFLSLNLLAILSLTPAWLFLLVVSWQQPLYVKAAFGLALAYGLYALFWSALCVSISAILANGRSALLTLIALWCINVLLLPRVIAALNPNQTLSKIEQEIQLKKALDAIGDSHNPDDPYFIKFREATLKKYGVSKIEDLPLNYNGLLSLEGERLSSELYAQQAETARKLESEQNQRLYRLGWVNPYLAIKFVSAHLASTDTAAYQSFLQQAETYRYQMVQYLNSLHAEKLDHHDDKNQRLAASYWHAMPRFEEKLSMPDYHRVSLSLLSFSVWIIGLLLLASRRLRRIKKEL